MYCVPLVMIKMLFNVYIRTVQILFFTLHHFDEGVQSEDDRNHEVTQLGSSVAQVCRAGTSGSCHAVFTHLLAIVGSRLVLTLSLDDFINHKLNNVILQTLKAGVLSFSSLKIRVMFGGFRL